ncbi:uncharacterized protein ColSpa_07984 [Colletotrichum spaethianum]|uniref:DUF7704 domain-containing protein n=1 Tax=Colletotrichum spaethianum TaxID=700344 RepID=A0AA37P8V9_9PEZI|nr:uncharacterized protein ColSpa_07984 [Colletotrichum spaethianum]GKT47803.1 hypothetical protein ColSpa_07984 [Colletotrichum spaethianum]
MTTNIPSIYRAVFLYWDPPCAIWGAYLSFFARDMTLNSFIPGLAANRDAAHDMMFYHQGGSLLGVAILNGYLLRYTKDVFIWKLVQASILCIDVALLVGMTGHLSGQGRLSPAAWTGYDWMGIIITGGVTIARTLFIAGVGLAEKVKTP